MNEHSATLRTIIHLVQKLEASLDKAEERAETFLERGQEWKDKYNELKKIKEQDNE